jgi:hypothetical protein
LNLSILPSADDASTLSSAPKWAKRAFNEFAFLVEGMQ